MKTGLTYLIFVIDRSGSMDKIRDDMTGGFNAFIKEHREAKIGECKVFAYKFDNLYETMFEDLDIEQVPELNRQNYVPRNMTALLDATCNTIDNIGARLASMKEEDKPEKVLIVTITDGLENDSRKFTIKDVSDRVKTQTEVYKWDFAYIGANQDAWKVASSMGYSIGTSSGWDATSDGTHQVWDKMSKNALHYRSTKGAKFAFAPDPVDPKKEPPVIGVPPVIPPKS